MNYQSITHEQSGVTVQVSRFGGAQGAQEVHLMAVPPAARPFEEQLACLWEGYRYACEELRLPAASAIFRRLFLSDYANQGRVVRDSPFARPDAQTGPVALSVVEQPPLPERKVALWAYHVHDRAGLRKEQTNHGVLLRREDLCHLWTTDLGFPGTSEETGAAWQTRQIFEKYIDQLGSLGADLANDVIRTWLFVQNVDVNYAAMVQARSAVFDKCGLTCDTHYIASTGIEGRHGDPRRSILFDAYAVPGIRPRQLRYLQAPQHLGPTNLYGVTFERGTSVDHGDRRHIFISGTASIEPGGLVLHQGDVKRQAERTFENIHALLADADAGPADLAQLIVYLRDGADAGAVEHFVRERYPQVPCLLVRAPVCRPDWLIEVECIAIRENRNTGLPAF